MMWLWQFMSRRSKVNFTVTSQCSVKNVLDNIQSYSSGWTTRLVHWGGNSSVFMCKWQEVQSTEPCVCVSKVVIGDPVWSVGSRCGLHPLHRSGSFVPHTCLEHTLIINAGLCRPNPNVQTSVPLQTHRLCRCISTDFKCWCCIQMLFRWFHFSSWKVVLSDSSVFIWTQRKRYNDFTIHEFGKSVLPSTECLLLSAMFQCHMATTKRQVYQSLLSDFFKTWEDIHLNFPSQKMFLRSPTAQRPARAVKTHNLSSPQGPSTRLFCRLPDSSCSADFTRLHWHNYPQFIARWTSNCSFPIADWKAKKLWMFVILWKYYLTHVGQKLFNWILLQIIKMHFTIVLLWPVYQQLIYPCSLCPRWLYLMTVNTSQ